jgi:signal transduction histidine kinase
VHLSGNSHRLVLTVVDDGVGFVVEGVERQGLGLISMGECVEAMDGSLNVWSSPHGGSRLNVRLPVPMTENSRAPSQSEHLAYM